MAATGVHEFAPALNCGGNAVCSRRKRKKWSTLITNAKSECRRPTTSTTTSNDINTRQTRRQPAIDTAAAHSEHCKSSEDSSPTGHALLTHITSAWRQQRNSTICQQPPCNSKCSSPLTNTTRRRADDDDDDDDDDDYDNLVTAAVVKRLHELPEVQKLVGDSIHSIQKQGEFQVPIDNGHDNGRTIIALHRCQNHHDTNNRSRRPRATIMPDKRLMKSSADCSPCIVLALLITLTIPSLFSSNNSHAMDVNSASTLTNAPLKGLAVFGAEMNRKKANNSSSNIADSRGGYSSNGDDAENDDDNQSANQSNIAFILATQADAGGKPDVVVHAPILSDSTRAPVEQQQQQQQRRRQFPAMISDSLLDQNDDMMLDDITPPIPPPPPQGKNEPNEKARRYEHSRRQGKTILDESSVREEGDQTKELPADKCCGPMSLAAAPASARTSGPTEDDIQARNITSFRLQRQIDSMHAFRVRPTRAESMDEQPKQQLANAHNQIISTSVLEYPKQQQQQLNDNGNGSFVQSPSPPPQLRRRSRSVQYADEFREYDELFLLHDYRLTSSSSSSSSRRQRRLADEASASAMRRAEALTSDKISQVRTIYFGGFFPWLADEKSEQPASLDEAYQGRQFIGNSNLRNLQREQQQREFLNDEPASQRGRSINGRHGKTKRKYGGPSGSMMMSSDDASKQATTNQEGSVVQVVETTQQQQNDDILKQQSPQHHHYRNTQLTSSSSSNTGASGMQQINTETRHQLGKFILPAVRLALDHINTNRSILRSYKLEVVPRDTQCNATISLKQFFDMVYEEPKKMLLYGDACRVSTDPIAKASYFFDLIQISYADTDPIYTIENYPNFFRVVPSENALSLARIPFIRHFNWTRVGTIYQNLPRYSLPHSKLLTDLERFQIVIKQSVSLPGSVDNLQNRDLGDELRKLKDKDVRIILGNFDEEWAMLLFCEAYREKMTGRKYQWLLTGFSEAKLWQFYETKGCSCSKQELLVAMDGYIITDITPVTRSQKRTISGMMAQEYLEEYQRRAREMNISIAENKFYGYVYDGIWAIALALNRVDTLIKHYNQLAREGKVKLKPELESIDSLLDFEYHQPIWVKLIREALNRTRFDGVTGTVSFHKNERPGLITFSQFQAFRDTTEVMVGSYDALADELDLNVGFPIIWRGSSPPIDYTIQRVTPFRINRTLFVIISILALLGIILACVFLFVNIKFRNQRYIKMSSPYLNNLIIIGCILTFTSVIILGLDSGLTSEYNFPYICNARAWVLMAGFTLAFGSMFSKTFRVHSIFTNIKLHKKVIKDYKLFMVVFILLTFDVCILIVWQYFDPFYRETNNGTSIQDPDNEDIIIVPEMEHCQSKRMTIFLSVIYIYKGLLMAFGCFLAWETRHVSIPALNDSKYIGLSVYNVVIMCVIGASLSFILRDQQDASFVIISIFIIFCSTTTLCLVFVPKLIELKQNPRAGDQRVRATLKTFKKNYHEEALGAAAGCRDIHGNLIGRHYGMNLNERIKVLVDENLKQRSVLKEKTYELDALTSKYRKIQSMVQAGQYLQAINTSAVASCTTAAAAASGTNPASTITTCGPTTITGAANSSFRLKTPTPSLGGPGSQSTGAMATTTVLLTSRSPTVARERVSFSALNTKQEQQIDVNPIGRLTPAIKTTTTTTPQDKQQQSAGSPLMSSTTQLTTTTTNITSDTSKFTSSTCGGGGGGSGDAIGSDELGERVHEISRQVAAAAERRRDFVQPQREKLIDSMTSARRPPKIQDLTLFTVLSSSQTSQQQQPAKRDKTNTRQIELNQWLEGPFCTVMLRQSSLEDWRRNQQQQQQQQQQRPGIAKIHAHSDQNDVNGHASIKVPTKTLLRNAVKQRLPRTLSMIEYLGLNEFDLIARRHEKILRYKQRKAVAVHNSRTSCCLSCSNCCADSAATLPRLHHQHHQDNQMATSEVLISLANRHLSERNLTNSDELLQTTTNSLISCSTCCSLASQTYASNSNLYDDDEDDLGPDGADMDIDDQGKCIAHSSQENSTDNSGHDHNHDGGGSSISQSVTSSLSQSSSIIIGRNVGVDGHQHHHHHHHHHHPRAQSLSASQSESASPSMSQSSLTINQSSGASPCPHHRAHHHRAHHQHQHYIRQHQHRHHHPEGHHHQHTHTSATVVNNNNNSDSQMQDNNSQNLKLIGGNNKERPLCTSGVLYGAPGAREGANEAARVCEPVASTSAEMTSVSSSFAAEDLVNDDVVLVQKSLDDDGTVDVVKSPGKITIRCDILEEL